MILAPFRLIVSLLFRLSYAVFHDPGWAVVGMSVLLSLLLTPLYVWIERRKNANRVSEAPMQAEIDKIEAVYTGRECFFYTREIHRRYGYKPLTALVPVLGLLIQIPFLLAAYHYLAVLPLFSGAPFLYIHDLSRPDTIARVAGIPVNLLAILMTLINLVSGWRYADPRKPKERIQYIAVALIFLVLLYRCASAVVLYWTLSQALSLVRSEVFFRKGGEPSPASWTMSPARREALAYGGLLLCMASALYFLVSAWLYPHQDSYSSRKVVSALWRDALFIVLATEVLASVLATRTKGIPRLLILPLKWSATVQTLLIALVCLREFTLCPIDETPVLLYFAKRWIPFLLAFSAGTLTALIPCIRWANSPKSSPSVYCAGFGSVVIAGTAYLLLTLFIWHPVLVLCSDPSSFSISPGRLAWEGFRIAAPTLVAFWVAWSVLLRRTVPATTATVLIFLSLVALSYLFLLPIECGTLQGGELMGAENLIRPHGDYMAECAFLCVLAVIAVAAVRRIKSKQIARFLVALNIVAALQMGVGIMRMPSLRHVESEGNVTNERIIFSKNHNNVLILMLDMVQGWSFHTIADDPALAAKLPGFTYFPNSLSVSTMTHPSIPTLYAGQDFLPDKLNRIDGAIGEKGNAALATLREACQKQGFVFSLYNPKIIFNDDVGKVSPLYNHGFLSQQLNRPLSKSRLSANLVLWWNAFVQGGPLALKSIIYSSGKDGLSKLTGGGFLPFGDDHDFLVSLPLLSKAEISEQGSYIFLHTEVTHNPWGVPLDVGGFREVDHKEMLRWTMRQIIAWFSWMVKNDVYDNTRIIIVSDHGLVNQSRDRWIPHEDPIHNRDLWTVLGKNCGCLSEEWRIQSANCLLCLKDFEDRFPMRIDNRLASNADTFPLAMSNRMSEILDSLPDTRRTFFVAPSIGQSFPTMKQYPISAVFDVRGNLFDLQNWIRLESNNL